MHNCLQNQNITYYNITCNVYSIHNAQFMMHDVGLGKGELIF